MLYKSFRSVAANTTKLAPDWQKLKVTKGTIKQWIIFSDPEAADMLHFKVKYHGTTIMPFEQDDWVEGFLEPIVVSDNIELDASPYVLDIYAYNEDDTFPHEYYIHAVIIRDKPVELPTPQPGILERWKKLLGGA